MDQFHETTIYGGIDFNLQASLESVYRVLSLKPPIQGKTFDEWVAAMEANGGRSYCETTWLSQSLGWKSVVRMTADLLPGFRKAQTGHLFFWLGDHLYARNRQELRVTDPENKKRKVSISELFFTCALRQQGFHPKAGHALWARCGDPRCMSPLHLAIVLQQSIADRKLCFKIDNQGNECSHLPTCIRGDPLPPPDEKVPKAKPKAGTSAATEHNGKVKKAQRASNKATKELVKLATIE